MSKLTTISIAAAFAVLSTVAPSFAANGGDHEITQEVVKPVKSHGKTYMIHMMKMSDGTVIYGMSKAELERLLTQRLRDFSL